MQPSWTELEELALAAGLDRVGVASCEPFDEVRSVLDDRKRKGLHGGLTFTYNDPARSTDVTTSLPWARSLVVGGRAYLPDSGSPGATDAGSGRIGRFSVEDFYQPLRRALETVSERLAAAGFRAEVLADDNRLVDRAAAVRAGVGWWGKNTMVLAPGAGPWMLLGSVATDAEIEPTPPMVRDCGTCEACLPACPTGALAAPGVLDARLCLAAVLQQRGSIPVELRKAVGDRVYGCDDCLEACPPGVRLLGAAVSRRGRVDLRWLLEAPDDVLVETFERFYLPRRRPETLRRNALVAAGNSGEASLLDAVERYVGHPEAMLAEHAAWAADQLVRSATPPA